MLVPRRVFNVRNFTDKTATRYVLGAILLERDEDGKPHAVATDGRCLLHVTWTEDDRSEYPSLPGIDTEPVNGSRVLMHADTAAMADKMPKSKLKKILDNIAVDEHPGDSVTFGATDAETADVKRTRQVEGRFPAWREVVKGTDMHAVTKDEVINGVPVEGNCVEVILDADYIKKMAETLNKLSMADTTRVTISVPLAHGQPVSFRTQDETISVHGLIMPMTDK